MTDELKAEREAFEKWVTEVWRPDDGRKLLEKEFPHFAFAAWQARAKLDRTHTTEIQDMNPCGRCGNTFIECFPGGRSWWVGCKPCSRNLFKDSHVRNNSREKAVFGWNGKNPKETL